MLDRRARSAVVLLVMAVVMTMTVASVLAAQPVTDWELKVPEGAIYVKSVDPAPRVDSLEGKTIGLYWNSKPGGDQFLNRLAELIQEKYPTARVIKFWEVNPETKSWFPGVPVKETPLEWMAKQADLVIASQGD